MVADAENSVATSVGTTFKTAGSSADDFVVRVIPSTIDFGDAPAPYPTTREDDGARHKATGPMLGAMKRIIDIRIQVKSTLGIVANGQLIPDKIPGTTITATPDTPITGLLRTDDLGFDDGDVTITLTQNQPLPFHILAIAGRLEAGRT